MKTINYGRNSGRGQLLLLDTSLPQGFVEYWLKDGAVTAYHFDEQGKKSHTTDVTGQTAQDLITQANLPPSINPAKLPL